MANFAIAADENVIARGNKLIEELQEPGRKKRCYTKPSF